MSHSARLGEPPNTEDDYYIVKAILQNLHLHGVDPAKGIHLGHRPLSIQNDTRGPQIITGSIVCIVLVVLITGSRLLIRALHPKVNWGWDDWLIIPGAVSHMPMRSMTAIELKLWALGVYYRLVCNVYSLRGVRRSRETHLQSDVS